MSKEQKTPVWGDASLYLFPLIYLSHLALTQTSKIQYPYPQSVTKLCSFIFNKTMSSFGFSKILFKI